MRLLLGQARSNLPEVGRGLSGRLVWGIWGVCARAGSNKNSENLQVMMSKVTKFDNDSFHFINCDFLVESR